ncbi:geranylgeranyl reductase family protein [Corynebacterium glucuronolyticum]
MRAMEFFPEVAIIGAGPAGSAAAIHLQDKDVLLIDSAEFPRDKTCGDGLTPRAMRELSALGIDLPFRTRGLKLHGFGRTAEIPWEWGVGSAMRRQEFDALLYNRAPAQKLTGVATSPVVENGRVVRFQVGEHVVHPQVVLVADGVRSTFGTQLGRVWHKQQVYGIAARSYCTSTRSSEPWIHSHFGDLPGYGWFFPLVDAANVGCGALSTAARPAKVNTKKLLRSYASSIQEEFGLGEPTSVTSAALPMGGSVSGVSGRNWALLGDSACCVNPLNGEGIDYALETARLAASLIDEDLRVWPSVLREHYGETFTLARSLAKLLTYPCMLPTFGPLAFRTPLRTLLMPTVARAMGNLIDDSDRDLAARVWHAAGTATRSLNTAPLWG